MSRRGIAERLIVAIVASGCAWMPLSTADPAYESTACGMT